MNQKRLSSQIVILIFTALLFGFFLLLPMVTILAKSVYGDDGVTLDFYTNLFAGGGIFKAFLNSVLVSAASGIITTVLAFIPAYAVNYTNISRKLKKAISTLVMLPMLLPTITYGFAIIYSFGKQGLITKLLGTQVIDIYGVAGLIIGYVIYTLPISFMLINNTMGYIDNKFMIVSRVMGDGVLKSFLNTIITPLISTFAVSFISVGVIEGSSVMGYTQEEYEALSAEQKVQECQRARAVYEACGADYVIGNLSGLCCLIDEIEQNG